MYVQDEKQQIVGNLPDVDKWDISYDSSRMWTLVVIIPQIGALVTYEGKSYEILSTRTYQENYDKPDITTLCRLLRISDEGDDMGEEPITVRADELALI